MARKIVLVVDDSPTELRLITGALQGKGYTILTAADGEQALEMASREKPGLIVLDIVLPKKNGFQVCRQIKADPNLRDTRVLLLSSKSQETDRIWGLKQGADEYMTKPFKNDELLAAVSRYV
jgi:twitching motility two-component system response regulator PilH